MSRLSLSSEVSVQLKGLFSLSPPRSWTGPLLFSSARVGQTLHVGVPRRVLGLPIEATSARMAAWFDLVCSKAAFLLGLGRHFDLSLFVLVLHGEAPIKLDTLCFGGFGGDHELKGEYDD